MDYLKKKNPLIPQLTEYLSKINAKIENLLQAIEDGAPYKIIKEKMDKLVLEKEETIEKLEKEKASIKTLTYDQIMYALTNMPKGDKKDLSYKEQCIHQIVNKVIYYNPDKIVIIFNYKKGNESYFFDPESSSIKKLGSPKNI